MRSMVPVSSVQSVHFLSAALPLTEQAPVLLELMEEVPPPNRLMLGWLTVHMTHVAQQVWCVCVCVCVCACVRVRAIYYCVLNS